MHELIVFFGVVAGGLLAWAFVHRKRPLRFKPRPVVTGGALEFQFRLQRALPECLICPQVAATALLEPLGVGRARKAALAAIVGRRVGYAVFDIDMQLLAVIELDHRPKLTRREAECDTYFASAGIKTLRFRARHQPSEQQIRNAVFPRAGIGVRSHTETAHSDQPIDFVPRVAPWRNTLNAHS